MRTYRKVLGTTSPEYSDPAAPITAEALQARLAICQKPCVHYRGFSVKYATVKCAACNCAGRRLDSSCLKGYWPP